MERCASTQTHGKTLWWEVLVHRQMANIMVRYVSTQTHGKHYGEMCKYTDTWQTLWWDVLVHRQMANIMVRCVSTQTHVKH